MKKTIKTILFILLASGIAIAQKTKTIEFESGYTAKHLTVSEKYVSVVLKNNQKNYKVNVYNRNGDLLFSKKMIEITGDGYFIDASFLSEKDDNVIIIIGEVDVQFVAYSFSIRSKNKLWSKNFWGSVCELSPDRTKLLNKYYTGNDGQGSIGILDLTSGNVMELSKELGHYATWIDNSKIFMIKSQYNFTDKYKKHIENKQIERQSIKEEIKNLKEEYFEGKYTKEKLLHLIDLKIKEYLGAEDSLVEINRSNSNRSNRDLGKSSRPRMYSRGPAMIQIYDIEKNKILFEKELFTKNGMPLILYERINYGYNLQKDNSGNIFLIASYLDGKQMTKPVLVKFDLTGNILWMSEPYEGNLIVLKHNGGEFFYKVKNAAGVYLVDKKDGQLVPDFETDSDKKEKINFYGNKDRLVNTYDFVNLNKEKNKMYLKVEGGEE
ncbi:MAG: hypothetical protein K9J16_17300 [Melioribacteraceae bacterium]|nr:hypothetical protein [Melioribacteraceae bacterium]MCF8356539.1 hypothetical protein [Melioribacteraceae bacterium]MCF8395933.1 hypothetical protein [Melioribacteraceae bacterium]MCF8421012.1 hypothetical protein [Melioribacteraceae bacterium]